MQRYAKNEQAQRVQLLIIPAIVTFVAFTGIAVTSASIALYGDVLTPLGPAPAHRPLGQPRRRVLRRALVHACHARRQRLRELPVRGKQYDCAVPSLHQHPPWADDLCRPWRVGAVPLGDPGERAGVLVVHERVQRVFGPVFGHYGCGREYMRPICSLCCVVTDRIGGA